MAEPYTPPSFNGLSSQDPNNPYFGTGAMTQNFGQMPYYPRYRSAVDPGSGKPVGAYSSMESVNPFAQNQINQNQQTEVSAAQRLGSQNAAGTWSKLAQSGGLSSGARERVAQQSGRDANATTQGVYGRMNDARLAATTNSANADLQTSIGDLASSNQHNLGLYSEAMKGWGAQMTADAQRRAAGQPGMMDSLLGNGATNWALGPLTGLAGGKGVGVKIGDWSF